MSQQNSVNNKSSVFTSDTTITATTSITASSGNIIASAGNFRGVRLTFDSSNFIDTYAVSTWTPVLSFGGASTNLTYGTQTGNYLRFANIVYIGMTIILTNKGISTGNMLISGLPYTVGATQGNIAVSWSVITNATGINVNGLALTGTTTLRVDQVTSTGASTVLNDTNFNNTSALIMGGYYYV